MSCRDSVALDSGTATVQTFWGCRFLMLLCNTPQLVFLRLATYSLLLPNSLGEGLSGPRPEPFNVRLGSPGSSEGSDYLVRKLLRISGMAWLNGNALVSVSVSVGVDMDLMLAIV